MKPTRLFDILEYQSKYLPQPDCLAAKSDGKWITYSTQAVQDIVNQISLGLLKSGIKKDEKIAIISFNRPEWVWVDLAIQQLGAVSVPMYPNITVADYEYIFKDAGVSMVFVGNQDLFEKVKEATKGLDEVKNIYSFDELEDVEHWSKLKELASGEDPEQLQPYKDKVQPEDLVTIIYTSGTTGKPKGVMLTHSNVVSNTLAVSKVYPIIPGKGRTLSFLPLCHIFERTGTYVYLYMGVSIYYAESIETIGENLMEVKPHSFATVPRLLEKVYEKIVKKGQQLSGTKKKLFFWAMDLGEKFELGKSMGFWYNLKLALARKLIFSKWKEALGGEVKFIVSGAAALQPRLARVFWAAGIPILEGYGMTESSPGISFTRFDPKDARIGSVGLALDGVEIRIAEDGEILTRGPHVMKGYYKRPDLTAKEIDEDGWLHTGDIGEIAEGRFLKITDRKKEIFKTSGGKYIAPQLIENKFKESMFIDQLMVVGEGEKFPAALIVPSFEGLKDWCLQMNIDYLNNLEMLSHPEVKEKIKAEIAVKNESFAQYERIKKFELLAVEWAIETGELTPTLKLKRRIIHKKFEQVIERFYR